MERSVIITENGRDGSIVYREPAGSLTFYWEFGGKDVVAIIRTSDSTSWNSASSWFGGRQAEILRYVADEVIRQKAPGCTAEMDTTAGEVLLRTRGGTATRSLADVSSVRRFSRAKAIIGVVALLGTVTIGGAMCSRKSLLTIDPGRGTPLGQSVRTDAHIATLVQSLEAYAPSLHRDASKDRFTVSIFVVPLDGTDPKLIPIASEQAFSSYQLAKVLGSDGRTLWFDVNGIGGVDLASMELMEPNETQRPPIAKTGLPLTPSVGEYLSAGFHVASGEWLGLHSPAELASEFAVGKFVRRVVRQDEAKQSRRLHRAALDAAVDEKYHRIRSMTPVGDTEYLNAAFLRLDGTSEPFRTTGPDGALMIYTSEPGLKGRLLVARVDNAGGIVWEVDTGIDRFKLAQILPGNDSFAFVGTRPAVQGKVSEPLLVIVETATGKARTISLWQ